MKRIKALYNKCLIWYKELSRYMQKNVISLLIGFVFSMIFVVIHSVVNRPEVVVSDWDTIVQKKTLRVLTMYSSTSYFIYRGEPMGYEYELIKAFADAHALEVEMITCYRTEEMTAKLASGEGDVIAFPIPMNKKESNLIFCGRNYETFQTLIQRKKLKPQKLKKGEDPQFDPYISNVTELIDKEVNVISGSRYAERLENLNKELGGGIVMITEPHDTLTVEDLIERVAYQEIDYTIADNYMASMNFAYYSNLDVSLAVSFPQKLSWAVSRNSPILASKINEWIVQTTTNDEVKIINKRYFERGKIEIEDEALQEEVNTIRKNIKEQNKPKPRGIKYPQFIDRENGIISVYDPLFKKYGAKHNVDWQLIAAIAYEESRFDTLAVSWAGARGIMQLMPQTARVMGCPSTKIHRASNNIEAGARLLFDLTSHFGASGSEQAVKLAIASYNVGKGHVLDARALASKYDKDPSLWDHNVEIMMLMKQDEQYYNDPVCRFGYAQGRSVVNYVNKVYSRYRMYKEATTVEEKKSAEQLN